MTLRRAASNDALPSRAAAVGSASAGPGAAPGGENASRDAILEAARAEFSAKGLTGARVNEIASRAGVNKQLIYYYFGSKDDLYRAVLESVYAQIRALERSLKLGDLAPTQAMIALIGFSFDYLARHPDFIGMLNHENAQGGRHVRSLPTIRETNSPLVELMASTLERGVQTGEFRRGIDPIALYVSLTGMSYFFFSNRLTLSSIFGRDLDRPGARRDYRKHVIELAMAGLRP